MNPSYEVRIGDRIRFHRQAQRKTQAVVAGLAGISEDYLSQIERGLKTPTLGLLHRLRASCECLSRSSSASPKPSTA